MSIGSPVLRLALVGAALPLLLAAAALALVWGDLPDPVAVHWGPGGQADGFVGRGPALIGQSLGLPLVLWAVLAAVVTAAPRSAPGVRWLQAVPAALTWFVLGLTTLTTTAQAGAEQAPAISSWWLAGALLLGLLGGAAAWAVAPRPGPLPARAGAPDPAAPRLPEGPAGRIWWSGRAPTGTTPLWIGVGVVGLGLGMAWQVGPWVLLLLLPAALLVVASARAQVTIGAEQLVVAGALAGWPRLTVPLASVVQADVTTTRPLEWGGWGLRVKPGATGVITAAGEALELQRTDGTRVVVTVEGAEQAAATVNTLLERR